MHNNHQQHNRRAENSDIGPGPQSPRKDNSCAIEKLTGAGSGPIRSDLGQKAQTTTIICRQEVSFSWKWVRMLLADFLPTLRYPDDGGSSQVIRGSLISLGLAALARTRQCDTLQHYSRWFNHWTLQHISFVAVAEPKSTATVITLYGLAVFEVRLSSIESYIIAKEIDR